MIFIKISNLLLLNLPSNNFTQFALINFRIILLNLLFIQLNHLMFLKLFFNSISSQHFSGHNHIILRFNSLCRNPRFGNRQHNFYFIPLLFTSFRNSFTFNSFQLIFFKCLKLVVSDNRYT